MGVFHISLVKKQRNLHQQDVQLVYGCNEVVRDILLFGVVSFR